MVLVGNVLLGLLRFFFLMILLFYVRTDFLVKHGELTDIKLGK